MAPGSAPRLLPGIRKLWPTLLGGALTVAMVGSIVHQLLRSGLTGFGAAMPASWAYYAAFVLLYLAPPVGDYVIFRRLWDIPRDGLIALIKKRIANEVLIGYSGDVYFFAWAKQRAEMVAAPFGAVKDAMILSAVSGNIVTLGLVALAFPSAGRLLDTQQLSGVSAAVAVLLGLTLPYFVFSKRVFSLSRETLWWMFNIHAMRQVAGALFLAMAWHFALPAVALSTWLVLAAARMVVSRLPFVPNKDLLFASLAIMLIGQANALTAIIAFTAALALAVHLVLMMSFGIAMLHARGRQRAAIA